MRRVGVIAVGPRVAPQLTRDSAGRAPQGPSDGPQRLAGGVEVAYPLPLGVGQKPGCSFFSNALRLTGLTGAVMITPDIVTVSVV